MQDFRLLKDKLIANSFLILTILSILIVVLVGIGLYLKSAPLLADHSIVSLLTSSEWKPFSKTFGFLPFILGTLWVTGISILISLPLSIFTTIFLSEYAPYRVRKFLLPFIDLLSGIPPVIYGVWGILMIVPFIENHIAIYFVEYPSGYSVLAGGLVLAAMIFPLIISILIEVFDAIPDGLREASLSLGATKWETVKNVLLKKAFPGIIAATALAISRAFGETIAVLMVCGNSSIIPHSIFDPVYPLPALIANNYGEMMSIPLYDSALMFAAFILFVIIFLFNAVSRIILFRIEKKHA